MPLEKELPRKIEKSLVFLLNEAQLKKEDILVLGCSTSEVRGEIIGSASSEEIARQIVDPIQKTGGD